MHLLLLLLTVLPRYNAARERNTREVSAAAASGNSDTVVAWMRRELRHRAVGNSALVSALTAASGGSKGSEGSRTTVGFEHFTVGMKQLGIDCDISTYDKLWNALESDAYGGSKDTIAVATLTARLFPGWTAEKASFDEWSGVKVDTAGEEDAAGGSLAAALAAMA